MLLLKSVWQKDSNEVWFARGVLLMTFEKEGEFCKGWRKLTQYSLKKAQHVITHTTREICLVLCYYSKVFSKKIAMLFTPGALLLAFDKGQSYVRVGESWHNIALKLSMQKLPANTKERFCVLRKRLFYTGAFSLSPDGHRKRLKI